MSNPPPAPEGSSAARTPMNVFDYIRRDSSLSVSRDSILSRVRGKSISTTLVTQLSNSDADEESIASLIITAINGSASLPTQKISVEYLRNSQKLYLPVAMGMSVISTVVGRAVGHIELTERYWRTTRMTYEEMKAFVVAVSPFANVLAEVMKKDGTPAAVRKTDWNDISWCTTSEEGTDSEENAAMVFGYISAALQMNCDIRDFAILIESGMSVRDDEWKTIATVPATRFDCKLKPFTLQCIAGLNYEPCAKSELAAWTRAYGVAAGIIPATNSRLTSEILFTTDFPPRESRSAVIKFERSNSVDLFPTSMNIIAMFGLFHLNKDHTYRTGDANMDRIAKSYVNTLRTLPNSGFIEGILNNLEPIVRTAPHPLGLAQCYYVAQVMGLHGQLTQPLQIRIRTCPPPVQRVFIVRSATNEWTGLPAGGFLNVMYKSFLDQIDREIARIEVEPPAFSSLHNFYGISRQKEMEARTLKALTAVLPAVYGYAMAQHADDNAGKDGIALALSLTNIARDQRSLAGTWKNLWISYTDKVDSGGLIAFAQQSMIDEGALEGGQEGGTGQITEE